MMKILLFLFLLLTIASIFSCSSPTGSCPNCNGNNPDDKWKLTAQVSGNLVFSAKTNDVKYFNQNISGSVFREIKATVNDGTNNHEIYISFLDQPEDDDTYSFSSKSATVIWTTIGSEPLIYQHNATGTLTVTNVTNDHISASFNFTATQSDSKLKVVVSSGILNFSR